MEKRQQMKKGVSSTEGRKRRQRCTNATSPNHQEQSSVTIHFHLCVKCHICLNFMFPAVVFFLGLQKSLSKLQMGKPMILIFFFFFLKFFAGTIRHPESQKHYSQINTNWQLRIYIISSAIDLYQQLSFWGKNRAAVSRWWWISFEQTQ